jgi:hypothetical protein
MTTSLERAVETTIADMIRAGQGPFDRIPVRTTDDRAYTEDATAITVEARRESAPVHDGPDSTVWAFAVDLTLRTQTAAESTGSARETAAWAALDALTHPVAGPLLAADLDLSRYAMFTILRASPSEQEVDEDGRRTRGRQIRVAVEESTPE